MKSFKKIRPYQYLCLVLVCYILFAFKNYVPRTIKLAGIVVNAVTLKPVEAATIYDADHHLLGTTDANGYFNVTMTYDKPGPISFKLEIKKEGLKEFTDEENWGDLSDGYKTVMYLGMTDKKNVTHSFSTIASNNSDLTYSSVRSGFARIKQTQLFEQELSNAKKGNQHTLFNIGDNLYIVDSNGWIKINSEEDLISINAKQSIAAKYLNNTILRRNIRAMTPLENKKEKFAITTK